MRVGGRRGKLGAGGKRKHEALISGVVDQRFNGELLSKLIAGSHVWIFWAAGRSHASVTAGCVRGMGQRARRAENAI